jgi:hypothetical protein
MMFPGSSNNSSTNFQGELKKVVVVDEYLHLGAFLLLLYAA